MAGLMTSVVDIKHSALQKPSPTKWVPLAGADWRVLDIVRAAPGAFFSSQRAVLRLEEYLAGILGVSVLATEVGRTAIRFGLTALGLGRGEGVLVPAMVCPTVISAILNAGCRPVFADVAEGEITVSAESLLPFFTPEVRAVLVPHLYCLSAPMVDIENFCKAKGVFLIDDAAQSFGLRYQGQYLGTFGDVGILSFGPFKGIASLRGGALVSRSPGLIEKARIQLVHKEKAYAPFRRCISGYFKYFRRRHFLEKKRENTKSGKTPRGPKESVPAYAGGYSLTGFDAALTRLTILRHAEILQARSLTAEKVFQSLSDTGLFGFIGAPDLPYVKIPVRLQRGHDAKEVVALLRELKIDAERIYRPAHLGSSFQQYAAHSLPNAEKCHREIILLPNPYTQGEDAVARMAQAVQSLSRHL